MIGVYTLVKCRASVISMCLDVKAKRAECVRQYTFENVTFQKKDRKMDVQFLQYVAFFLTAVLRNQCQSFFGRLSGNERNNGHIQKYYGFVISDPKSLLPTPHR